MLCKVCVGMLRGGRGDVWAGTHDLTFEHHKSTTSLRASREADCSICIALTNVLRQEMDLLEDQPISIRASLRQLSDARSEELKYCLDFELEKKYSRIFLLKQTNSDKCQFRTPRSHDTSSDEVFEVAQSWISKCASECMCAPVWDKPDETEHKWYPKRLLDLEELRSANGLREVDGLTLLSEHSDLERKRIYLIESSDAFTQRRKGNQMLLYIKSKKDDKSKVRIHERENHRYVTLSHCWGKPRSVQGQLKLSQRTEERFKRKGIELRELPKTFRDAILFACRLDKVGFIWIDSLCIIQPNTSLRDAPDGSVDDWLEQSRTMDNIYRQSYLNISATAAADGDQGLFFNRKPEYLWEDEINVNYTGTNLFGSARTGSAKKDTLTRCTLIDVSFWDDLVERAPVNRRGWVLQERVMAPRVLHFCRDQIAWECAGFVDAEGHPEMNPTLRPRQGEIVDEGRLKDLTREAGDQLRNNRLKGVPDPDIALPDLHMYELWKRMVEVYSRMQLTVSSDKLIALSGIARRFHDELFEVPNNDYIAGMWGNHLESQLLWQVEELFKDGVFENPARRDATRAPSFSWASIDSPNGIVYPDVTDFGLAEFDSTHPVGDNNSNEELFIKVVKYIVYYTDKENPFGMLYQADLLIRPRYLAQIELRRCEPPLRVPFSWRLKTTSPDVSSSRHQDHSNLYLDAPESDVDIFRRDAELYVMPVAYGERTVRKSFRYMYCLLLQYEKRVELLDAPNVASDDGKYRGFKRIGITKLSNHMDERGQAELKKEDIDEVICLC